MSGWGCYIRRPFLQVIWDFLVYVYSLFACWVTGIVATRGYGVQKAADSDSFATP